MDQNETATEKSMQDITSDLEGRLFGSNEPEVDAEDAEVIEGELDDEALPEDDDSESDEEEGSEDLDGIADLDEDLTLASYLGVDEDRIKVDDEGNVSLEAIVDGERKDVPLTELVSSYQLQSHVNNKSIALENERKEFEQTRNTAYTELKQRLDGLDALGKVMEQSLVDEYNSIDWDRLRSENPAEWTALRQDYAERAQKIQQSQALVKEEATRQVSEQQQQLQIQQATYLKEQMDQALANNPTWSDESVRKQEVAGIIGFMKDTYGFQDEDLAVVQDARAIQLIQDAMKFRSGQKGLEEKKGKKVPKFKKPGAAKASAANLKKARDIKAKRAAIKKSGSISDAANLLVDRM